MKPFQFDLTASRKWIAWAMTVAALHGMLRWTPSLAQESSQVHLHKRAKSIRSWGIDPFTSHDQEAAIFQWMKDRPKAKTDIATYKDLLIALRDSRSEGHAFEIAFDVASLSENAIAVDSPLANGPLQKGADLLSATSESRLTFRLDSGTVTFTTVAWPDAIPDTRIYDVTPLVSCTEDKGTRSFNHSELRTLIQNTVDPDNWEEIGGTSKLMPITINQRCLFVVVSTYDIHLALQSLLDALAGAGNIVATDGGNVKVK